MSSVSASQATGDSNLEPVDRAAVDEGGKHPQAVAEGVADGAECQHDVQMAPDALHELVVHVKGSELYLQVLKLTNCLHLSMKKNVKKALTQNVYK